MQERDISEELLNVSAATADGGTEHATMNRSAPEAGSLSMMMLVPDLLNLKDTCGESLTSNSTIQQEITPMNFHFNGNNHLLSPNNSTDDAIDMMV
ncbi:uncharacterized protein LOC104859720 isoform X4 [Fukomys damarensis]|uniref:uncharacterized protein LOC104859720 isoform X4 n=1 Tax=Fukomys damarensis TaxID=885580 RepID=UPI001455A982|nr:uncharacterized protein LOC104859720 isoform X4 [Fukomys damarensis]